MLYGYAGKLLRVDLSEGKTAEEEIEEETLRKYIGGTGLAAKIMYDEVPPGVDAFDAENRLIIVSGVFGGTMAPSSGTVTVASKSPVTSFFAAGSGNGFFGARLRLAGYDGIVVKGASDKPVYLSVNNREIDLEDAQHLWGKDSFETEACLKEELGDSKASVLSIGPAGENLVRFACPINDGGHTASTGGNGAVMGSKRLKAIVVSGTMNVPVKDQKALVELRKKWIEINLQTPTGKLYDAYGTAGCISDTVRAGMLPVKNLSATNFPEYENISGQHIREVYKLKRRPCFGCPMGHGQTIEFTSGPYKGFVGEEPEYENIAGWGPNLGISDLEAITYISDLQDRLGMDLKEAAFTMSLAFECYEKGLLTDEDTEGIELKWGDVEAVKKMLEKIARREGLGDILAEGVKRAAYRIGGDAPKFAVYLKGYGPHTHDVRANWGLLFGQAVSDMGSILGNADSDPELGIPGPYPRWPVRELPLLVARSGLKRQFIDCLGVCNFLVRRPLPLRPLILDALKAVTGWDFSLEEALAVGERVINIARCFNVRHGYTPRDDEFSPRLLEAPSDGPSKGISIAPYHEGMLREYYRLRGWDEKTGKPFRSTLQRLSLDHVIKDIWS